MLNKSQKGGTMEKTIKMNVWGKDKELTLEDYQGLWKSQILEFARLPMFCRYDKKSFDKTYDNYNKLKEIADEMVITAFNSRWEHQNK
tara:strand:+ start:402 stop:665 length:264 start_codon:yes stop_codon:yes gene_type:complete